MTDSTATIVAVLFGLGVFAVIVAVGWRSVQNRRIVRMQGANGQETVIVAGEDDEVTSVATAAEAPQPVPSSAGAGAAAPDFGRKGETSLGV